METKKKSVPYIGGMHLSFRSCKPEIGRTSCNFAITPMNLPYPKFVSYFHSEKDSLNNSGYFFSIETPKEYMQNIFDYVLNNKKIKVISLNSLNFYNFRRFDNNSSGFINECSWMNIKILNTKKIIDFIKLIKKTNFSQNLSIWFNIKRKLEFIEVDKDSTIIID